jgi:DNA repair and recombination protein RAD54B
VQLRDIFTIHPGTACHSHDLLDCPCDRIGTLGDDDATPTADAALEDDSKVTVGATSGFTAASQVKAIDYPKADKAVGTHLSICKAGFSRVMCFTST